MKEILKKEKRPGKDLEKEVVNRPLGKNRLKKISSFIKKGKVLDVGCAIGELSKFIDYKKVKYVGIDNSKDRINVAKKKETSKIKFILGFGEKLPFKKETFDYVVIAEVIEHVENPSNLLKECKRVLKKRRKDYWEYSKCNRISKIFKSNFKRRLWI